MLKHQDRHYHLFSVVGDDLKDVLLKHFHFNKRLDCLQFAYLKKDISLPESDLHVRVADNDDIRFIADNYDSLDEEEIKIIVGRKKLLIGEVNGQRVGFIGEHLEGSMGLLYVLEEYRKSHYGSYLEAYKIKEMLKEGFIPFGQVVWGNEKSMNMQKKLGMTASDIPVYWFF